MPMPPLMRRDARSTLHATLIIVGVLVFVIVSGCANSRDTGFLPGLGVTSTTAFPPAPTNVSLNGTGSGVGGGGGGGGGGPGQGKIYVGDQGLHKILVFNATDNGDIAPRASITVNGDSGITPSSLSVDTGSGRLYILEPFRVNVAVYDSPFSFNGSVTATPDRTFDISNGSTLGGPVAIAIDSGRNILYVAYSNNTVAAFANASTLSGVPPAPRLITGFAPGAPATSHAFFKPGSDRLLVSYQRNGANVDDVFIFDNASSATGNVSATSFIGGASTGLNLPTAVAVDASNNIFAGNFGASTLTIYTAGSTGNVAPAVTAGAGATRLATYNEFSCNDGSTLFVADFVGQQVSAFNTGSLFNQTLLAPGRNLRGTNTTLTGPLSVAHDPNH